MSKIEPGERFKVGYGNGHSIDVLALNLRNKRKLIELVERVSGLAATSESKAILFDIVEEALRICVPGLTDELLDTLDEGMGMEIVTATLGGQVLSDDDKKKSESPLLSAAENSVSDVAAVA
jgi:hypothetical protein